MIVTALEELSASRSKVYIDGELAFVLYKGELRSYHLSVGEEIAQKDYGRSAAEAGEAACHEFADKAGVYGKAAARQAEGRILSPADN